MLGSPETTHPKLTDCLTNQYLALGSFPSTWRKKVKDIPLLTSPYTLHPFSYKAVYPLSLQDILRLLLPLSTLFMATFPASSSCFVFPGSGDRLVKPDCLCAVQISCLLGINLLGHKLQCKKIFTCSWLQPLRKPKHYHSYRKTPRHPPIQPLAPWP